MRTFEGVWPALVTPHTPDRQVNVTVLREIVEYLIGKGVDGFYVGGTTGEGIFMPVAQRRLVVETVLEQVKGRVPVLLHVGAVSADDAVDLARHARECGAAGVSSILPPLYDNPESLRRYFHLIAASVPDLAFLVYLLNPNIDAVALLRQVQEIPNLAGAKYTGPNMFELRRIIELGRAPWTLLSGMDEQFLYAQMMGANGGIGSTLNIMPGVYRRIRQLVQAGQYAEAQELQLRANRVTAAMIEVGFPGALKAVMGLLGFECGDPRLPNLPLTSDRRHQLEQKLEEAGFAELAAM